MNLDSSCTVSYIIFQGGFNILHMVCISIYYTAYLQSYGGKLFNNQNTIIKAISTIYFEKTTSFLRAEPASCIIKCQKRNKDIVNGNIKNLSHQQILMKYQVADKHIFQQNKKMIKIEKYL